MTSTSSQTYLLDRREALLRQWASSLDLAASRGALAASQPIAIREIGLITGPRAGALEIDATLDAGRLLRALSSDDMALTRQFVPWRFVGNPSVYMSGRYVRVEAGWDDSLAQKLIGVNDLNARPGTSGHWLAGMNERGRAIVLHLSDAAPHFLISGATGSGKSVCIRSLTTQLAQHSDQLVLLDGKFGEGLRDLDRLPGVVGPLASDMESARGALAWVLAEMVRRYERSDTTAPRLCVVIDEVQELLSDIAIAEMVRRIAAQGRVAKVSLFLATQHPTTKALGDDASIKRNVPGRIALRVADYKASEVAIGQATPRADWLLGAGDAYIVVPGQVERLQIAYYERREITRLAVHQPRLTAWPPYVAEELPSNTGYSGAELAIGLSNAYHGFGRPALMKALSDSGLGRPGSIRAERLLKLGREQLEALRGDGFDLCLTQAEV